LAPEGWHIPSNSEWQNFVQCLGTTDYSSGTMKQQGNAHWNVSYDQHGIKMINNNISGFTALAGGRRYHYGAFNGLLSDALWCSLEKNSNNVASCSISYNTTSIKIGSGGVKAIGYSVRCLKN
jgi:uncharacterized protein (TIGR02145 family)